VLRLTTDSLRADVDTSPLRTRLLSLQFNGADGFYLLFDLPARPNGGKNGARLEDEARRFRDGTVKRLRQSLGRPAVDLMSVHASCIKVPDDPRVRPSRHILRGLQQAARPLGARETQEKQELLSEFRALMAGRRLRAVFQPVVDIRRRSVLGYEALIRGPLGSELETPDVLFAAAREAGLELELENLCLETIKREIITALASLARQIESSIVAEGIEHPDELRSLLELGVNYGQGYLLGRPSPRVSH
jgi:hypothetical protein